MPLASVLPCDVNFMNRLRHCVILSQCHIGGMAFLQTPFIILFVYLLLGWWLSGWFCLLWQTASIYSPPIAGIKSHLSFYACSSCLFVQLEIVRVVRVPTCFIPSFFSFFIYCGTEVAVLIWKCNLQSTTELTWHSGQALQLRIH